ncbi:MAG: hypothetical protein P8M80_16440, partial [Pirellulaceae bacterium]|nr:hypothetical protein [Pirellulaceae bacterium]
ACQNLCQPIAELGDRAPLTKASCKASVNSLPGSSQSPPSAGHNTKMGYFYVPIEAKCFILVVSPLFYFESRIMILRLRTSMHRFEVPFRIDTSLEFRLFIRS